MPALDICATFHHFYTDLLTYSPHDVTRLMPEAQAVQAAALAAVTAGSPGADQLLSDANNLTDYVGSHDFPNNGNVMGAPVQSMSNDCP